MDALSSGFPRLLRALAWLLLLAYLVGLFNHGPVFEPLVDVWLGILTQVAPAAVCWVAVASAGPRRREVIVFALAVSLFCLGNIMYVTSIAQDENTSFPAPSDLAFLAFYPLTLAAIAIGVRRELRSVGVGVWLDSLLGALGAAAVLAVVLDRVFTLATGHSLAVGIALVYPILDLMLMAATLGTIAMQGRDFHWHWVALLLGLALFATVDVITALSLADSSYAAGGMADAIWPAGLLAMSYWAVVKPSGSRRLERPVALAMPAVATAASLAVLVAASRIEVSALAVVLATLTVIVTAGRTQLAFLQLRRLADLRRQATTDELTGLPNRRAFYAQAETQLATSDRVQALLLLDLDRFKEINDSLGHTVGDRLLIEIGMRLTEGLRDGDLLARLGGDEFGVLLADADADQALLVAAKLRNVVAEPCTLEGIMLRTDVSIGLALAPEHGRELSVLLRRADIAMYQAKRGRQGHRVYNDLDDAAGADRLRAIQELHTALAQEQMLLHYQPKLDLRTNQVNDVEALVRWEHPTRGLLYPDSFLALIEDAGLMHTLTQFVLKEAMDQAAIWHGQGRPLTVAVNLSPSSLVDTDLPGQIAALLADRHLPAGALQLEITEEFLMADRDRTRQILAELRGLGIQIAVDDFGTGYSSLSYLRELPIDELKIDKSFVFPMSSDARAAALVFSIIGLAHSLGLRVVAEGAETGSALTELARNGCDQAQGYHISRALPIAEFDLWLEEWNRAERGSLIEHYDV